MLLCQIRGVYETGASLWETPGGKRKSDVGELMWTETLGRFLCDRRREEQKKTGKGLLDFLNNLIWPHSESWLTFHGLRGALCSLLGPCWGAVILGC